MTRLFLWKLLTVASVLIVTASAAGQPVGTAFTYQGSLQDAGQPANGSYDMEFTLYSTLTGGTPATGTISLPTVSVVSGLFTVQLDFGPGALPCEQRFLEIAVRPTGDPNPHTIIAPRQELTPTPYAICSQSVLWSGIIGIPAGFADGIDNEGGSYTAGDGLELNGSEFSIDNGGVVTSMLADLAVTTAKINDDAVTYEKLADNAVMTEHIYDKAVTTAKLDDESVSNVKLKDNAVTTQVLDDEAVTTAKLDDGAVTNMKLADNAVGSDHIGDGQVKNADLDSDAVTPVKISETGSSNGQALISNGFSVSWGNPVASALVLPYTESVASVLPAVSITNTQTNAFAIYGKNDLDGVGVVGEVSNSTNSASGGVKGKHLGRENYGYLGTYDHGVYGRATRIDDYPVYGSNITSGDFGYFASQDKGAYGFGHVMGVHGKSSGRGVYGEGGDYGVYGDGNNYGIYGTSSSGWAGYFNGDTKVVADLDVDGDTDIHGQLDVYGIINFWNEVYIKDEYNLWVSGSIYKGGGGFKIDHPDDPTNKWLYHSFVESSDMKNMYDGVVTLDPAGEAIIEMPTWFASLNRDFRYQLTAIGAPDPTLHVALEFGQSPMAANQFKIGGAPNQKVSWAVTGIRQDTWANENRVPVEEAKTP